MVSPTTESSEGAVREIVGVVVSDGGGGGEDRRRSGVRRSCSYPIISKAPISGTLSCGTEVPS